MSVEIRQRCKVTSIVNADVSLEPEDAIGDTHPGDLGIDTIVINATAAAAPTSFWNAAAKYEVLIRKMS